NDQSQITNDSSMVEVLDAFQNAIVNGNKAKASMLLADNVRILEGGGIETREEYLSHHFYADGEFLSAMEREIKLRSVFIEGNAAWITTNSRLQGNYNDQPIDLMALELAVLKKVNGKWKIAALHWSSSALK